MKYSNLTNFVTLPTSCITLPSLPQSITNDQVIVFFNSLSAKLKWYSSLDVNKSTIIFNCGLHNEQQFPSKCTIITDFNQITFDQLLHDLKNIMTNQSVANLTPSTIIIDDLSTYYWELKNSSSITPYLQLYEICNQLTNQLSCNIIITGWDNSFEKGINYHRSISTRVNSELSAVTFLPISFISGFNYVVVYMKDQFSNGKVALFHHEWRIVGEF